jgi:4-carboxymuconolactone decarboxylase
VEFPDVVVGPGATTPDPEARLMARLPFVDPDAVSDDVRAALAVVPPTSGVFKMVAHAEGSFRPWLVFGGTLSRELELEPRLRQLAILQVAVLTDCEYERIWHETVSLVDGVRAEQIAAITSGRTAGCEFDELETLVLRFVSEAVERHGASEATTLDLSHRLSNRSLVELLLVIAHYLGLAVLLKTTAVEPEPALSVEAIRDARRRRGELS